MNRLKPGGSYSCQWSYRDQTVLGEARLEVSQTPTGNMFGAPETWRQSEGGGRIFSPELINLDSLRGWTHSGEELAFIDVNLRHFLPERARIQARLGLIGVRIPDSMQFSAVEFQVGGLTELSGVHPLKEVSIPIRWDDSPILSATWNTEDAHQRWQTESGDEVTLDFTAHINFPENYSFSVTTQPIVRIRGAPRSPGDWLDKFIRPLAEITTLATHRKQHISWVRLGQFADGTFPVQAFAQDIDQLEYDAASVEISDRLSDQSGTLIRLGPAGASLSELLQGWVNLGVDYKTFFEYLKIVLRGNMTSRSNFLVLIPALESFHVARYGDGPISRADYKKERRSVIEELERTGITSTSMSFIKEWLSVYGSYTLVERLRQIVNAELSTELRERIQDRIDPLPTVLDGVVQNASDAWAVMATVRNRIAHGSQQQPTPDQLGVLNRLAHTVAIGLALRYLHVPDKILCDAIDQRRWMVV